MVNLEYTTVDRLLSKFHRDLRGTDINESDAISWIGEALDFLKVHEIQEQAVAFIEVKNNQIDVPEGLQMVLQIARRNNWTPETKEECSITSTDAMEDIFQQDIKTTISNCVDCDDSEPLNPDGTLLFSGAEYNPYADFQWDFPMWTTSKHYVEKYTPVRLANHVFFNSLVCKEKTPYENCGEDEYTIVGTYNKKIRFSFSEGYVAVAFVRNAVDNETGYPLVPDNISYVTAITYYVKWKIAERMDYSGREGWSTKADKAEQRWLKYARQGKNYMKMPKGIDQFQNLLEQSHQLIPRHRKYYGYFGNIGREEDRKFNDPDGRTRPANYYGREYNQ